ncbi:MAG: hypothetical protein D6748_03435 [Calditrichaeota bacterium]|nr:MAG: hypothetical protein D6748_03435 [Calditrichota bacterium]
MFSVVIKNQKAVKEPPQGPGKDKAIAIMEKYIRWHLSICVWLVLTSLVLGSPSQSPVPPELDSLLLQGKEEIYNLHLLKADSIYDRVITEFPDYPHGYVYEAYVTLLLYGMDLSNDSLGGVLADQIDVAMDYVRKFKEKYPQHAESYFMDGLAKGIIGIRDVVNRSYIKGYFNGRSAKKNLEKVVELDSTYYDAYLGLGIFHYYADLLPGVLKFVAKLLGFGGDRKKGKEEILLTAQRGKYFRVEGKFVYHSARYFLEGEKHYSFLGIQELYKQYPDNGALGLMIAYHYRRTGFARKCIEYLEKINVSADFPAPQIPNLKYYNMAVSYYDLNEFEIADSLFQLLYELPTRKSLYYQAAINFYRGHLADLRFDHDTAVQFYRQIPEHKQTQYWFQISRSLLKYPTDSLMYQYFITRNLLYERHFDVATKKIQELLTKVDSGATSTNPDFPFFLRDLLGEAYYFTGFRTKARDVYQSMVAQLSSMEDEFRKAWIYIHYGRVLRSLGYYELAEKMFDKATNIDDDYTRLIVSREKYVLKEMEKKNNTRKSS